MVVFGQSGCIRQKWLYSGKTVCVRANSLYLVNCGCGSQSGCIQAKVVSFG